MRMQMSEFHCASFPSNSSLLPLSFRRLRGVRAEGERDGERVSGHEQAVPHRLLRLLLLRQDAPRKGVLQRQREDLLRGGLHGSRALNYCLLYSVLPWPIIEGKLLPFSVFRIPTDLREVRNVRTSDHGNGKPATCNAVP